MKRAFFLALLLWVLSIPWTVPFCYFVTTGSVSCAVPIIVVIKLTPLWFAAGLVIFTVAWLLDKKSKIRAARIIRWAPFVLMLLSGVFFFASEALRTCIVDAAEYGENTKLKACLVLGGNPDSMQYNRGPTALWIAVSRRHLDVIDSLLAWGAGATLDNPCSMDDPIRALKQYSTRSVDEEIRQKLIKAGAQRCPD